MARFTIILCIMLTGCASNVDGAWQCANPKPGGSPCVNIAQADAQVKKPAKDDTQDKNPISRDITADVINSASKENKKPQGLLAFFNFKPEPGKKAVPAPEAPADAFATPYNVPVKDNMPAHRTQETVSRVWFAPFIDKYNNRHEESFIYVVDQESTWRTE